MTKLRLFFPIFIDTDNFNAQSLNIREIVRRLDPKRFDCTLFFAKDPDPRIAHLPHVRLHHIPRRLGTLKMLSEVIIQHDIVFNLSLRHRFTDLYFQLPQVLRRRTRIIQWIESELKSLQLDGEAYVQKRFNTVIKYSDAYVAITEHVAEEAIRDFNIKPIAVIPIGVDTKVFSPQVRAHKDRTTILFIGHLDPKKNPALVLEAARRFRHVDFILVGNGRNGYEKNLQQIICENQLTNVQITGTMPQTQLSQLMGLCDMIMLPSFTEGMPKVILEAAATGLPGLIFDFYQAPAIVNNVTGYQVKTFDEMIEKMGKLVEDESLRQGMSEAAIQHAQQFSWDIITRQWEKIFMETIWE